MPRSTLLTRRFFSAISLGKLIGFGVAGTTFGVLGRSSSASETEAAKKDASQSSTSKLDAAARKSAKSSDEVDYHQISEAEWKKRLTASQFQVTRKHGTEPAFSGKYHNNKKDGVYRCVCCKTELFDSLEKFDSGTGWPSFWKPREKEVIEESSDDLLGYRRTEVHCTRCAAHLGHVFQDAPKTPTGLRYCINSVCLVFVPRKEAEADAK